MRKILRRLCKRYLIYSCKHKFTLIETNYPDAYLKYKCKKCKKLIYHEL